MPSFNSMKSKHAVEESCVTLMLLLVTVAASFLFVYLSTVSKYDLVRKWKNKDNFTFGALTNAATLFGQLMLIPPEQKVF
jgi:hypothetical protein